MSKKNHYYFNEGAVDWDCEHCEEENRTPLMWMSSPHKKKEKKHIAELVCDFCLQTTKVELPIKDFKKHTDVRIK